MHAFLDRDSIPAFQNMLTIRDVEKKLEDCKRLAHLYDLAISLHEKKVSKVRRGIIRFTQISDSALLGLVEGDLKRLNNDKKKVLEDQESLDDQLKSLLKEKEPEASNLETNLLAPVETIPDLDRTLQESNNTAPEPNNIVPESVIIAPETFEPSESPLFEFETNSFSKDQDQDQDFDKKGDESVSTPDLLTAQEIIDTLKDIDNHQDDQDGDGLIFS